MVPVLLGVVDILVFLVSLRLFILVLRSVRPFIVPLFIVPLFIVPLVPRCMVPLELVPAPGWGVVVMVPLELVDVPAGVVWAKAAVLRKSAHVAATNILVVFIMRELETGRKEGE